MASRSLCLVVGLFVVVQPVAAMRDELHAASRLSSCEMQVDELQRENDYLRARVLELENGKQTKVAQVQSFLAMEARSLAEMAAVEGELIVPSADVMQVLGDVSSKLAVKKQEYAVLEQSARIAAVMAKEAVEANAAAGEVKDEKEATFNKLLEEYQKAEEAAEKQLESAEGEMEAAKADALKTVGEADDRLKDAEKKVKHAQGLFVLSTTQLNGKKPDLEKQIQTATEQIKALVGQQTEDLAKVDEAKDKRDALAEELQKTKDTQDQKTQEALEQYAATEGKWLSEIEVLSDKVDAAERKLSAAKNDEQAARSVSGTLTIMQTEKEKEHAAAMKALKLYTQGNQEMETYQFLVDELYKKVTNCERKWFKGALRSKLMDEASITKEDVDGASKLHKPRGKDEEGVVSTMKKYFAELAELKTETSMFATKFGEFNPQMSSTLSAVETETAKLANMACKYWAVTTGGKETASNDDACKLFVDEVCGGKCSYMF
mmetsp:Transcript_2316/g.3986  ORF Transcript_2316/g.3986 Transcript_2316/m.3986 type:complete len:491 (-) Transcript_2316:96-1568(-)